MLSRAAIVSLALALALPLGPGAVAASGGDAAVAVVATEGKAASVAVDDPGPPAAPVAAEPLAKTPAVLPGNEVHISAEHLERSSKERVVIGEGAVRVRQRDMRLIADRVVYNEQTKDIVADGNVVLDRGADRIQGEHLELNLESHVGFMEHAQGFIQTYYFAGERLEKVGPDHYFLRGGSFTTCEGVAPDWSFHTTSTDVTIDEYLYAWNPTLRIKSLPVLYFPYAILPVKRDRSTGLLIPTFSLGGIDGFVLRNAFFWAPRDNFDATIGHDYLQKTGWGANGEVRYLFSPRTQGIMNVYNLHNSKNDSQRWSLTTRNSQELPLGMHAEIEAFFQSDREFISTQGKTIEERSSERTTSSFFINRSWSAWNFALAGRHEVSLITEKRTTLTRFPELTIDRTSTQFFGTDLFLKVAASGVILERDDSKTTISTTRLHLAPEMNWPFSLGSVARIIPTASYALTNYSENTLGVEETRSIPSFRIGLEGPRPYRIWDLSGGGRITKIKHLVEPSVSYVYTPEVNQETIPRFDSLDLIAQANRLEYSVINTFFGKMRTAPVAAPVATDGDADTETPPQTELAPSGVPGNPEQLTTTQELLWIKLWQNYTFDSGASADAGHNFSAVDWEVRTRPFKGLEIYWRGNVDVYGEGIGYQNLSLSWKFAGGAGLHGDWRSTRDSDQDFLDIGGNYPLGRINLQARSRYNLAQKTFVENRINVKYISQCWDVALDYVKWTNDYEYTLTFSLKGVGTILKI